ncbi:MAG: hypothetical protein KGN84_12805 [Acidobacteriota bacterium]|nr:hypothetical protein [Acidobacteriota bacterium]
MKRLLIALGLTVFTLLTAFAQAAAPPAEKGALVSDKFSGTVTELSADAVTVVRTALGKSAVTRRFLLDGQTKVEGAMKLKSRVTVQYQTTDDGDYKALHIIVR